MKGTKTSMNCAKGKHFICDSLRKIKVSTQIDIVGIFRFSALFLTWHDDEIRVITI